MMMNYYTSIIIIILLALAVLSILILDNNRMPQEKKRIFIVTNSLITLAAIVEYIGVWIGGHENIPKGVLAAVKAADYIFTPMTGGALIMLMYEQKKKNRLLLRLFIGNAVIQVLSVFQGWMVVINDQNHYTHGRLYPLYMAFYLLIIVILMLRMLEYGKSFHKQNRGALYATITLVGIGIGMQEFSGGECRVAYLAAAFGVTFLYIHYSEFSQLRLDEKIIEQQAMLLNDPLTGVFSRFAYIQKMNTYADCLPGNLAVFLIDINGLKTVNDSVGHEAGDELICAAARCIRTSVGKNGETFRIGGDEFVVFASMAQEQVELALLELKHETEKWSGETVDQVSLSVGYARAEEYKGFTVEELVKEADKGMYEQKKEYYRITGRERRSNTS